MPSLPISVVPAYFDSWSSFSSIFTSLSLMAET